MTFETTTATPMATTTTMAMATTTAYRACRYHAARHRRTDGGTVAVGHFRPKTHTAAVRPAR